MLFVLAIKSTWKLDAALIRNIHFNVAYVQASFIKYIIVILSIIHLSR